MDTLSKAERSERMSRVRCKDTRPELVVRSLVHRLGYRFRLHDTTLPGRPDLVLRRHLKVIFVHGCFWHRHRGCPGNRLPKSRKAFWRHKLDGNKRRDGLVKSRLTRLGWRYLVVWECETRSPERVMNILEAFLGGDA